jgi:hypothetical protein
LKNDLPEYNCPLCQSPLESENYHQAIADLKKKVSETFGEENKKAKQEFDKKLEQLTKSRKEEIAELEEKIGQADEAHKSAILELKSSLELKNLTIQKEKEEFYKQQLAEFKKIYADQNKEIQDNFKEIEEQIKAQCKKYLTEKDRQLSEIKKEQKRLEDLAFDKGKANADLELTQLKTDVKERDLQIERFRRDTDELKKQLEQKQSELGGEVGERDLYYDLTQAFPNDSFSRQVRGKSMGDIVQKIRTATNVSLDTPIVFDNKQAESVTAKDIEKAKKYKEVHGTDYVIIVSRNLPKKDIKNGFFGEKEGILLCHPCILPDVVRQIRRAIIEISKQSGSRKDRESKESKLYDYIRSSDFSSTVEKLHDIYQKAADLQDHEEKAHEGLWKQRKKLQSDINNVYSEITTGVDCIIQEKLPMQELADMGSTEKEPKDSTEQLTAESMIAKRKKKKVEQYSEV